MDQLQAVVAHAYDFAACILPEVPERIEVSEHIEVDEHIEAAEHIEMLVHGYSADSSMEVPARRSENHDR
jgi:hypothetical protein